MMIKLMRHCKKKFAATDRQSLILLSHSFTLDGLAHCKTEQEAQQLLAALQERFKECGLELHPDKTKIVYCKDSKRKRNHPETQFTFLGYTFRKRRAKSDIGIFAGFTPAVSKQALNTMRERTRQQNFQRRTDLSVEDIAKQYNPVLRGWLNYYGCYNRSSLKPVFKHFNTILAKWAMRKFKKLRGCITRAGCFIREIAKRQPDLFVHWEIGVIGDFA